MKAEYADGWVGYRGTRLWAFNVTWNAGPLVSGSSSAPIETLNLVLWHYAFSGFEATPGTHSGASANHVRGPRQWRFAVAR